MLGGSECGQHLFNEGNYQTWLSSVAGNPVLCDFTSLSLMPIWELCESSTRRTEVEDAFQDYAKGFELPGVLTDAAPCVSEIIVKAGLQAEMARYQEAGFRILPDNLNEQAGGAYIYLLYKEGLDTDAGITALSTISGANPAPPAGWFRIKGNLNEGTGPGDPEIYLCYQKEVSQTPARQLQFLYGEEPLVPAGFELVANYYYENAQNFNHGTEGDFIYLAFSRELPNP